MGQKSAAAVERDAFPRRVVGHGVSNSRRGIFRNARRDLRPSRSVVLPGVAENRRGAVAVAAEEHHALASGVVGHLVVVAGRGAGDGDLRPRRAIPLPGVVHPLQGGLIAAAEEHGLAAGGVVGDGRKGVSEGEPRPWIARPRRCRPTPRCPGPMCRTSRRP